MKLVISLLSILIAMQAQARECTTPAALEQAVTTMKSELESDLTSRINQVFIALKAKVPSIAYAQMQSNKRLSPVQAVQVEAILAQELQRWAKSIDNSSECFRNTGDGGRLGAIGWVCSSRQMDLNVIANNGGGDFYVLMTRRSGKGLQAPIAYTHQVLISERYNKIETSNSFREVLFPAHGSFDTGLSGYPVGEDIRVENLDQLQVDLVKANQTCE